MFLMVSLIELLLPRGDEIAFWQLHSHCTLCCGLSSPSSFMNDDGTLFSDFC